MLALHYGTPGGLSPSSWLLATCFRGRTARLIPRRNPVSLPCLPFSHLLRRRLIDSCGGHCELGYHGATRPSRQLVTSPSTFQRAFLPCCLDTSAPCNLECICRPFKGIPGTIYRAAARVPLDQGGPYSGSAPLVLDISPMSHRISSRLPGVITEPCLPSAVLFRAEVLDDPLFRDFLLLVNVWDILVFFRNQGSAYVWLNGISPSATKESQPDCHR